MNNYKAFKTRTPADKQQNKLTLEEILNYLTSRLFWLLTGTALGYFWAFKALGSL